MKSQIKFKKRSKILFLIIFVFVLFLIFLSLKLLNQKILNSDKISNVSSNITQDIQKKYNGINQSEEWTLTIPKIYIDKAPIQEGIDTNILNGYVGHFPTTSKENGNIGLAAHNRGYSKNYFANIYKLNIGDEIIYINNNFVKRYKVSNKTEIDSYDWSYLNSTNDDTITLITCVTNKPDKRLVVQAKCK